MKLFKKNHGGNFYHYFLTVVLISIIFFFSCVIKGIFPFGSGRIDISDFQDQSVPLFYFLWDVFHGEGNLFFTWDAGSGLGFNGVVSFLTLLSPFNLLLFFIKRSWIEPFMTFFVLIKFVAMGLSMCFFLRNFQKKDCRKLDSLWIVLGSTGYALSAYSVQYYLLPWLDIAALFPLLIYALLQFIKNEPDWHMRKYSASYLLLMTTIFIVHIPQAYMVCFYLILFAGSYFFLNRFNEDYNKERNRSALLKFGLLTLLALAISAVVFIPAAAQIMQSGRIGETNYSYFHLLAEPGMDPSCKRLMLYSVLVPLIYLIATFRKNMIKTHLPECIIVSLMILPVFAESTNILWHMGPYICFPMRFGYMMIFTVIAAAGKRMAERQEQVASGSVPKPVFSRKLEYTMAAFWLFTILVFGIWLIRVGRPGEDDTFIQDCEEVRQILPDDSDVFHKTKLSDASLSHNYPLVTQTSAFSNYVHLIPQVAIDFTKALGYTQNHTILSDTGGTLFSDALLGYTYTFKSTIPNQQGWEQNAEQFQLYHSLGETEHFATFSNQYVYPARLTISQEAYDACDFSHADNPFLMQNVLSKLFFSEEFFTITDHSVLEKKDITCNVQGKGIVYLYSADLNAGVISVNGEKIPVPDFFYGISDNTYPAFNNNGILGLGCYENETIHIEIDHQSWANNIQNSTVTIGILDFNLFLESTRQSVPDYSYQIQNMEMQFHTSSPGNEYLFIPCLAQDGWKCTINESETALCFLNDTFLLIPLAEGENDISLTYVAPGKNLGLIISIASAIFFLLWLSASKLIPENQLINKYYQLFSHVAFIIFQVIYFIYLFLVDIVPAIYSLAACFIPF